MACLCAPSPVRSQDKAGAPSHQAQGAALGTLHWGGQLALLWAIRGCLALAPVCQSLRSRVLTSGRQRSHGPHRRPQGTASAPSLQCSLPGAVSSTCPYLAVFSREKHFVSLPFWGSCTSV